MGALSIGEMRQLKKPNQTNENQAIKEKDSK